MFLFLQRTLGTDDSQNKDSNGGNVALLLTAKEIPSDKLPVLRLQ